VATSVSTSVSTSSTNYSSSAATSSQGSTGPWYSAIAAIVQPSGAAGQPSASRLSAIAAQSVFLNGFVLLPLLVAVILGALLYRASGRPRRDEPENQAA
jgi:hypothetical protein